MSCPPYVANKCLLRSILQFEGIDDHFEVKSSLENLDTDKLRDLGGALGLRYPKLRRMTNILDDMTAAWLNKEDSVLYKSGEPTWSGLTEALEKIGQMGVAEDIKNEIQQGISAKGLSQFLHLYQLKSKAYILTQHN